jgi:hypothetical protein
MTDRERMALDEEATSLPLHVRMCAQRLHGPTIAAAVLRWVGSTASLHIHARSLYALGASAFLADYPEAFSWPS